MKVSSDVLVKTSSTHSERLQQLAAVREGKNGSRLFKIILLQIYCLPRLKIFSRLALCFQVQGQPQLHGIVNQYCTLCVDESHNIIGDGLSSRDAMPYQRVHQKVVCKTTPACYAQDTSG